MFQLDSHITVTDHCFYLLPVDQFFIIFHLNYSLFTHSGTSLYYSLSYTKERALSFFSLSLFLHYIAFPIFSLSLLSFPLTFSISIPPSFFLFYALHSFESQCCSHTSVIQFGVLATEYNYRSYIVL